ncbi:phage antirepressor N-terminal domain-containing protein [Draconibacterium orientale]|uniref:phage antirepressor N-terminal domain-containing protein n=1 Tax=Draconibacterium orientale TaxID=1168034 RepID=UPI0029BFF46E|nr:phage antirepressor N-terminal domain-containing protein [Draconibacterium orientale]
MNKNSEAATLTTVAKVNNTEILVVENGEKRIAVKPICEALGVSVQGQLTKLKNDPILSSTIKLSFTVGGDGKQREMQTIPFKFVFGWLFRIDSRNVKPEAKETVERYQLECYNALYNHFTRHAEYVEWQKNLVDEQLMVVENINHDFSEAKNKLLDAKKELNRRRGLTIDDFVAEQATLSFEFPEEKAEG